MHLLSVPSLFPIVGISEEEPILDTKVEFTYSHLMAKLLRLPKYLQLEIGKALIANASEGFEEEDDEDSL
jgi:hypothetical protein